MNIWYKENTCWSRAFVAGGLVHRASLPRAPFFSGAQMEETAVPVSPGPYSEFMNKYASDSTITGAIAGMLNYTNALTGRGETITNVVDDFMWIGKTLTNRHLRPGNMWAAMQLEMLQELGITHIVACTSYGDTVRFHPDHFKYLVITLDDIPESDLSVYFHQSTHFIKECEENKGKVLVHCAQGEHTLRV